MDKKTKNLLAQLKAAYKAIETAKKQAKKAEAKYMKIARKLEMPT